jgi:hypothetical protein
MRLNSQSLVHHRRALPRILALAASVSALVLCAGVSPAGAAEGGLNISSPEPSQVAGVRTLGVHWARMFLSWPSMQPSAGAIDPIYLNNYEAALKQLPAGTKVIIDVVGTPQWETGSADEHTPPANPQDYAEFVASLAHRLAPWVSAYEIWNEEDSGGWWAGGPDAAAYTRLLQATYPAVKAADPAASVLVGGLTGNDYSFVEALYRSGAKGFFDAVAVHTDTACNINSPYSFLRGVDNRLLPDSFLAYREVHAVMLANGDDKSIWMTELSWRTTSATCSEGAWAGQKGEGVSDEQQATYLTQAYHCLAADPYVKVALWFPLTDEGIVTSGLVRADGSRKPAWAAMRSYVRDGDTLTESCGEFTGPRITVLSPANHLSYSGPLPIHVLASSSQGVFRIRLEVDGHLIRNYDGGAYPSSLSGVLTWQGAKHIALGAHTLTFLAYDKSRNVSQTSITIFHTASGTSLAKHHAKRHARKHRKTRRKHG